MNFWKIQKQQLTVFHVSGGSGRHLSHRSRGRTLYSGAPAGRLPQKISLGEAGTRMGSSFTVFGQLCWLKGRGPLG